MDRGLRRKTDEGRAELIQETVWVKVRTWNPLRDVARRFLGGSERETLEARLRAAGLAGKDMTAEAFVSLRLALALGAFVAVAFAMGVLGSGARSLGVGMGMGVLGYLAPTFWLGSRIADRKLKVEKGLLNFVSMMAVTCDAGLSLAEALERVSHELGGQIGEEVQRVSTEVKMGALWGDALERAAGRYQSADLSLVLGSIATSTAHGTAIAGVLRESGRQLRQARRNRAQEQAQKASAKILVPIILLMFVPLAILLVGPPVLNLLESLIL
jgi:tight adherence protein C